MIDTKLCALLGIEHPIILAPVGNTTDAALVSAVSEAGGLGLLSCGFRSIEDARHNIAGIRQRSNRPFGVNFVLHVADPTALDAAFAEQVPVYSFFRGHPAEATARAHGVGAIVIHQITTVAEAEEAIAAGVDVIVAQGTEAGGHNGPEPLWQLLPRVVAIAGATPVVASGGITDGSDLAAALAMGASGVMMGTRFLASSECNASDAYKAAIVAAGPQSTVASSMWDQLWGQEWPGVTARAIRNAMTERWVGREAELDRNLEAVRAEFETGTAAGDPARSVLLAGMGAARIRSILPAGQIVRDTVAEAERALRAANAQIRG